MGIESISAWKSLQERELREHLVIDAHRCSASCIRLCILAPGGPLCKSAVQTLQTLALYTREASAARAASFKSASGKLLHCPSLAGQVPESRAKLARGLVDSKRVRKQVLGQALSSTLALRWAELLISVLHRAAIGAGRGG